ncbi:Tn3 family transposase [Micromonospora sp. NPDC047548]|uniref:Tn3 family transposase n=1 Tax=Micromonospora sp. NPDC047548 TaxID=3155624 RepID=UPI0034038002
MDKLGGVGEPESLTCLKATTEAMLPRIDLPDLLFEAHSWTGFLDAFKHVSARPTRMDGLLVSLVALLVSEACNIGLTPVSDPDERALTASPEAGNGQRQDGTRRGQAAARRMCR